MPSTFISTASPTFTSPLVTLPRCTNRSPTLRWTSLTAMVAPFAVVRVPAYVGAGVAGVRQGYACHTPTLLALLHRHG